MWRTTRPPTKPSMGKVSSERRYLVVDDREPIGQKGSNGKPREDVRKYLDTHGVSYVLDTLTASDYKLWDDLDIAHYVTRKSSDFAESLFSGHFQDEIQKILVDPDFITQSEQPFRYSRVFFVMEGVWDGVGNATQFFKRVGPNYFRGIHTSNAAVGTLHHAQVSLSSVGIEILHTGSLAGTASMLAALVDRAARGWPAKFTQRLKRPQPQKTGDVRVQRLMGLWPNLREDQAAKALEAYGSVRSVIDATSTGRFHVQGIGSKGLDNVLGVLDGEQPVERKRKAA